MDKLETVSLTGRPPVLAQIFAQAGAAVLLPESELTDERLTKELTGLLGDPERLREMGSRARTLAHPDALQRIAQMAVRLAAKSQHR